jgi:hypothetical protein
VGRRAGGARAAEDEDDADEDDDVEDVECDERGGMRCRREESDWTALRKCTNFVRSKKKVTKCKQQANKKGFCKFTLLVEEVRQLGSGWQLLSAIKQCQSK